MVLEAGASSSKVPQSSCRWKASSYFPVEAGACWKDHSRAPQSLEEWRSSMQDPKDYHQLSREIPMWSPRRYTMTMGKAVRLLAQNSGDSMGEILCSTVKDFEGITCNDLTHPITHNLKLKVCTLPTVAMNSRNDA